MFILKKRIQITLMFNPEDFNVPLEKMLKLRMINDEIDKCKDVKVLQEQVKETSRLLLIYQHLLGRVASDLIRHDLKDWSKHLEGPKE